MICNDCGETFFEPNYYEERHGFSEGPYEYFAECPYCGSESILEDEEDEQEEG